jgi:hypothetical protein
MLLNKKHPNLVLLFIDFCAGLQKGAKVNNYLT